MSEAHAFVGELALVLAVISAIWAVAIAATRRAAGPMFIASFVWVLGAIAIAAFLGAARAILVGPPHDALHIVYGVLALGTLPGAALVASGRPARQQTVVATVAAIVLVILLLRLVQTGA